MHHDTGYGHPERPERLSAIIAGIESSGIPIVALAPEPAPIDLIATVHDPSYIAQLERFCSNGGGAIDMDTFAVAATWEAALRAAAAGPAVCAGLEAGGADLGYVAMRPPGHHAMRDRAMGFCFFNNIAITAAYLQGKGKRVAIVDWDVHHGNGTQDTFYGDPDVLYLSIHQEGIYPGTGSLSEVGSGAAAGTNLNIAVPGRTGGEFYRRAVADLLVPVISQFEPDWLLVSAGYDAHKDDPLAGLSLLADDYGSMAQLLAPLAPTGRSVVFLEGGYDLDALRQSAAATIRGWIDPGYQAGPVCEGINPQGYLSWAQEVAARYWKLP